MIMRNAMLALASFGLLGAAPVQAQVPHTFSAGSAAKASEVNDNFTYLNDNLPKLIFANNTCTSGCLLTTRSMDNPITISDRQVVASLDLPAGQYLVTAKLGADTDGQAFNAKIDCTLRDAAHTNTADYGSSETRVTGATSGLNSMQSMQLPIDFSAGAGTVQVACVFFIDSDSFTNHNVTAHVFAVNIAAVRVAGVTTH
jgi:hypothetical protein